MAEVNKDTEVRLKKNRGVVLYQDIIPTLRAFAKAANIKFLADGLDISETTNGVSIKQKKSYPSIVSQGTPWKILLDGDEDAGYTVRITRGHLYIDDSLTEATLSGVSVSTNGDITLTSGGAIVPNDYVVLKLTFDAWPTIDTATIIVTSTPPQRSIIAGDPPEQTESNTILGKAILVDGAITIDQYITSNLRMTTYLDSGVVVCNPMGI